MQIDSFTIMVVACFGIFLFGAAFLFFWFQDRRSGWLAWWSMPYFLGGTGVVLFIPRGLVADWLSIGLANALLMASFGLVWQGARVFVGRRGSLLPVAALALGWGAVCAIPGYMESTTLRIVVASALVAGLSLLTARELWTDPSERLPSRFAAVVVLCSFALFIGIRIPLVGYLPFPMGAGPMNSTWLGAVNLTVLAHVGAFAILMVSLTKERREAEQRAFAMLDPLTGLMNRRAFMSAVERAGRRRLATGREELGLMVLDLDDFKQINDRHGHEVGDRVLQAFASVVETEVRSADSVYRMGGEEFCIILPDTPLDGAVAIAERIRQVFALNRVDARGMAVGATVSIGIASTAHAGFDLEVLFAAADAAVYEAKSRGRNQVVVASPTTLRRRVSGPATATRRRA